MPDSQEEMPLLDRLWRCSQVDQAPFYTPGHKQGQGISPALINCFGSTVFRSDLPELPELDNLFAPQGVIQQAQERAAALFGAEQTWFLANGSTCGIVAAILATCAGGEKIILPRNVHYSAISGLILSGALPVFVQPEYDPQLDIAHAITPQAVAAALAEHPDAKAVIMVSPTYYGVCGDVGAIAHLCHQSNIPLLVDEAHGAHFTFHPDLPMPALAAGADLVVQSTHKTLSALTQAAMLHLQGDRVDRNRLSQSLALVQSTSPSYLLLASLDAARQQMATRGQELLEQTLKLADWMRSTLGQIPGLATLNPEQAGTPGFTALDRTRLTVTVSGLGIDGFTADEILRTEFGVVAELPSLRNLTFIVTAGNRREDGERLVEGFRELVGSGGVGEWGSGAVAPLMGGVQRVICPPRDAFFAKKEAVPLENALHRVSAELVCPYPPGIPVLMPGEEVTGQAIAYLQKIISLGGTITGCAAPNLITLQVMAG
jgi:arginine/lysine/ornithine decarboxylase